MGIAGEVDRRTGGLNQRSGQKHRFDQFRDGLIGINEKLYVASLIDQFCNCRAKHKYGQPEFIKIRFCSRQANHLMIVKKAGSFITAAITLL